MRSGYLLGGNLLGLFCQAINPVNGVGRSKSLSRGNQEVRYDGCRTVLLGFEMGNRGVIFLIGDWLDELAGLGEICNVSERVASRCPRGSHSGS